MEGRAGDPELTAGDLWLLPSLFLAYIWARTEETPHESPQLLALSSALLFGRVGFGAGPQAVAGTG